MHPVSSSRELRPLPLAEYDNILFLTGAGISVASGLPTYRGSGGLWDKADIARIADAANLPETLPDLWSLYSGRRQQALKAAPNAAHYALAAIEKNKRSGQQVTVVTQNVDGLHRRAGSEDVLEMHGSAFRTRCYNEFCSLEPFADETLYETVPTCPVCQNYLRPDIVLFGEKIPTDILQQILVVLSGCELFVCIGTSGAVAPASDFVRAAAYVGARTININVEPSGNHAFAEEYVGKAEEILPQLLGIV